MKKLYLLLTCGVTANYESLFGLKIPEENDSEVKLNLKEGSVLGRRVTAEDVQIEIFKGD